MPRTLTRLRYKPSPKADSFAPETLRRAFAPRKKREKEGHFVTRQRKATDALETQVIDNERQLKAREWGRLRVAVDPKARRPATGERIVAPRKPYTLKDVVDPEGRAQHGQIIYIFRNDLTNQIIYSFVELLKV